MKPLFVWLALTLAAFGSLGGAYHLNLTGDPRKVLVIVDSSFAMKSIWHRLPQVLDGIGDRRYAAFGLMTEKNRVHGWQSRLVLGRVAPYAPRDFAKLKTAKGAPEAEQASEVYFLTNAAADQLDGLPSWTIIRP